MRLLETGIAIDVIDERVGRLQLLFQLWQPFSDARLCLLRWIVDVQSLQLMTCHRTRDGKHRVEGFNLLGGLLQLAGRESVYEVG